MRTELSATVVLATLALAALPLLAQGAEPDVVSTADVTADAAAVSDSGFYAAKLHALVALAGLEASLYQSAGTGDIPVRLYIGNGDGSSTLERVRIFVDGAASGDWSQAQDQTALHDAGKDLLRLPDLRLAEGEHDIHAEIVALIPSAGDAGSPPLAVDQHVRIARGENALELSLVAAGLLSSQHAVLALHRSDDGHHNWLGKAIDDLGGFGDRYSPGSAADPTVRYVRHLLRRDDGDDAVLELLRLSIGAGADVARDDSVFPSGYWLLLSEAYRRADLPDQATLVCDRLDRRHQEHEAVAVERLWIGDLQHRLGDSAKAEAQYRSAEGRLPEYRLQDWQVSYAQLLFERDEYPQAQKVLQSDNVDRMDAYRYMNDSVEAVRTSAIRRYNLAVAMIKNGEETKGLSLLDLVGRLKGTDNELATLRDKANLALGWHFLEKKQGRTAMGALGRVRSEGEFSSTALLGMGWAELEPAGDDLQRVRQVDPVNTGDDALPAALRNSLTQLGVLEPEMRGEVGPRAFARERAAGTREEGLQRAITLWNTLDDRDTQGSAVLEAALAIAYAYDGLRQHDKARVAYARAIGFLEAEEAHLDSQLDAVRHSGLSARIAGASQEDLNLIANDAELPPGDTTRGLYASIARLRDLERARLRLIDLQQRMSGPGAATVQDFTPLVAELSAAESAEARLLDNDAISQIAARRATIDRYLQMAYFAAARESDSQLVSGLH